MDGAVPADAARLTATEALRRMAAGQLTAEALVAASLARIGRRDGEIRAWLALSETALDEARRCDAVPLTGSSALVPISRFKLAPIGPNGS